MSRYQDMGQICGKISQEAVLLYLTCLMIEEERSNIAVVCVGVNKKNGLRTRKGQE